MAITRCPYCHAIIDEADKYCNNCGTQLLFSEDEEIEEEIPGEKIVDAEVEEKDYTVDEPESEKRLAPAEDPDAEADEEIEEDLPAGTAKTAIDELMAEADLKDEDVDPTEEVVLIDEIEAAAAADETAEPALPVPATESAAPAREGGESGSADFEAEDEELADELQEDLEDEIEEEPVRAPEAAAPPPPCPPDESHIEYLAEKGLADESATAGEASLRPATFDSKDLENLGRTVELGREKIDRFIEVMAERTAVPAAGQAAPETELEPPPEPAAEPEPEAPAAAPAISRARSPEPATGTLPPWATSMKGAPVFLEDTGPVPPAGVPGESGTSDTEEVEIFPRSRDSDSTIGLPEKVGQAPLPFARPQPEEGPEEEPVEEEAEDESFEEAQEPDEDRDEQVQEPVSEEPAAESRVRPSREPILPVREAGPGTPGEAVILPADEGEAEAEPRPPFRFSVFFKSKIFDLLFVGLFWLVALWLAAASMEVTLFDVLGAMSGSMLMLYAVFVLLYFFLFRFFLGETLGDRLFRPRE